MCLSVCTYLALRIGNVMIGGVKDLSRLVCAFLLRSLTRGVAEVDGVRKRLGGKPGVGVVPHEDDSTWAMHSHISRARLIVRIHPRARQHCFRMAIQPLKEHPKGDIILIRGKPVRNMRPSRIHRDGQLKQVPHRSTARFIGKVMCVKGDARLRDGGGQGRVKLGEVFLVFGFLWMGVCVCRLECGFISGA